MHDSSDQRCRYATRRPDLLGTSTNHIIRFDDCDLSRRSGLLGFRFYDALHVHMYYVMGQKKETDLLYQSHIHLTYPFGA